VGDGGKGLILFYTVIDSQRQPWGSRHIHHQLFSVYGKNMYVCVLCMSTFVWRSIYARLLSQHPILASVQASVVKLKLLNIICSN